ncbi:beta-glucosidase 12-like [Macadamia integrifolia]|uniref:beta-glucosidase 12-like n=1 Tax=Macadamia integrifolia TaxID=60698 RepID=UPI001C530CAE|nr:beta-glucosidase 12-like [Macadamia integrifolia]
MLKLQLPRSEFAAHQSQLLLPKPFLSGHESAKLAIWQRPASLFQNHKSCSIRARLPSVDTKPAPRTLPTELSFSRNSFPPGFYFGTASSAYQYEGAPFEGGKGLSNWDYYCHTHPDQMKDKSNGDVAVDFYHRYKEDIAAMKDMGMTSFRFSIAWTRIFPDGKKSGGVNREGVQFYNDVINELLANGIEPFVTLFHWDVPQALEVEYGGFLSTKIIDDFRDFAEVCYGEFGDRVKYWMTLNEPWTFTTNGYVSGAFPPSKTDNTGMDPYTVAHNLLLAHAAAVDVYRKKYKATQNGQIGITLNYFWMVPYSDSPADQDAAARASDFMFGWFMEPVTTGEYPKWMIDLVGPRLPRFYKEQSDLLRGSYDFLGLNYYTATYAQDRVPDPNPCYTTDSCVNQTGTRDDVPIGIPTASEWLYVYPKGMRDILIYIKEKYNNPVIYVAENGVSDDAKIPMDQSLKDELRKVALRDHLKFLLNAVENGVDVKGFFMWSFLDNFEWDAGYTVRFGINYVDFENGLKRYPKESAHWFKNFLKSG